MSDSRESRTLPSLKRSGECCQGGSLKVDPCAKCPENPIVEFHKWLDTYGTKNAYDRGDLAACWYAGKRAALSENADITDAELAAARELVSEANAVTRELMVATALLRVRGERD